ncbi:MAG: sulfotransferase domain-containing protein, partial [Bacteroidetes bacterium]|nr:sulfotransferase domain-containing protein [Bacteroidota bacterium]
PIEEQTIAPGDIIDQGILLWNCMHHVISQYKKSYGKDWYFVRHEDLSSDAAGEFQKMFAHLDLTYDQKVATHIVETTQANKDSDFKRDATKNIKNWKNRLTSEEIYRIKKGTHSIWSNFYNESDW